MADYVVTVSFNEQEKEALLKAAAKTRRSIRNFVFSSTLEHVERVSQSEIN